MTPTDRRLHPLSILFDLGSQLVSFALPGLLFLVGAGSAGLEWQAWLVVLIVPYSVVATGRYLTFRYRYEPGELVIRSGLFFRNERHIPYARIQNIDAVQNVLHRLCHVVEVRMQTGGGTEPEATLRVLPVAGLAEMRERVFAHRVPATTAAITTTGEDASAGETTRIVDAGRVLLHLSPRDLVLCGLVHNRGTLVIAAALGLLWEVGLLDRTADLLFGDARAVRNLLRQGAATVFGDGGATLSRLLLAVAGFVALLVVVRIFSVGWALVRLYGFTLTRIGEDVRVEFGLITRVVATIPLRRIQTLTVRDGPLHRLSSRVSVRVATAGGTSGEEASTQREWLAPLIHRDKVATLLREVAPEVDLARVEWEGVHRRAFGREFRAQLAVAAFLALPFIGLVGWWSVAVFAVLVIWVFAMARLKIRHLRWAITDAAVCLRSGALWRYVTVARFAKIQAVALHESPFDRRAVMARVRVDTAGGGDSAVDIPYLARQTADTLHARLAQEAAETAFRW